MPRTNYPPKYMITFSPRELADAAWAYVSRTGEAHPAAPRGAGVDAAIRAFDGNDASIARILSAYLALFKQRAPNADFLRFVYRQSPRNANESQKLTDAALEYVYKTGEGHPAAPWTAQLARAFSEYDGSDASIDRLYGAYMTAFDEEPPHPKFLAYAFP